MSDQQYRILGPDEIIQEGDELNVGKEWIKVKGLIGVSLQNHADVQFRRPIPAKSATSRQQIAPLVIADIQGRIEKGAKQYGEPLTSQNGRDALQDAYEEALDLGLYLKQALIEREGTVAKSATVEEVRGKSVWVLRVANKPRTLLENAGYFTSREDAFQFASKMHLFGEPLEIPPVKESLTTDPDESSDNSRSFQEIKILGEEVEMWKKLCRENDADLVAMKLRAEKAEDGMAWLVEMVIRDERIKGTNDPHGWIRKALECGVKRREELKQAERERDAISENRDHFCHYINLIAVEFGTDKDNSAPEAVLRWVQELQLQARELKKERDEAKQKLADHFVDAHVILLERDALRAEVERIQKGFELANADTVTLRLDVERLREALERILNESEAIPYRFSVAPIIAIAQTALALAPKGDGITDDTIAVQAALAGKEQCQHDSVNSGTHPTEGFLAVCNKCGKEIN